ncbi:MAG: DUF4394 domain-containing protein [Armatimonadetes bacterium]|nr:DUF4394 domain-containing protein [Armatimonadota bacterium]
MTFTQKLAACAVAAFGIFATNTAANAQTAFAIGNGGTTLISFDVSNPGAATVVASFSGATTGLDAIDFRPLTTTLYGYNDIADSLFTIDTTTGVTTLVANSTATTGATNSQIGGLDFNPAIDRVRFVNIDSENRVYNPNAATAAVAQTTLAYAAADSGNDGTGPSIVENAYNNNLAGTAGTQYAIDNARGTLVTLANAAGTLNTVGSLGLGTAPDIFTPAIGSEAGFDIFTSISGVNTAYAILGTNTGGGIGSSFYTVNLGTGLASAPTGSFSSALGSVYSLAVVPVVVPEANTGLLVGVVGLLGMVGATLRRRAAK